LSHLLRRIGRKFDSTARRSSARSSSFDFSGQQLRINARDVVPRVIHRGKLGAEDDAVVVANRDIAERALASQLNAT
jgi:hypothetical protein